MAGLYIHIPFCSSKCFYCGFHSSISLGLMDDVVDAIIKEIHLQKNYLEDDTLETIYFGGGTPSLISIYHLERIFTAIYNSFPIESDLEITLEANPDNISSESLQSWYNLGINRLSVGIQSFNDRLLKIMNRTHNTQHVWESISLIERSKFDNYNLDFIFAIPTQTKQEFEYDLQTILKIKPPHISCYMLSFEEKSVFGVLHKRKSIDEPAEDFSSECFLKIDKELKQKGYDHYEISNFARDKKYSKHNSNYWSNEKKYLGIGPSAASYNILTRQTNIANNPIYVDKIRQDIVPATVEILSYKDKRNEFIINNLRTFYGLNLQTLKDKYKYQITEDYIDLLKKNDLTKIENRNMILTAKGMLVSNSIIEHIIDV